MMAFKVLEMLILANYIPDVLLHNSILTVLPDLFLKWSGHARLTPVLPHVGNNGVFEWKRSIHSTNALPSVRCFILSCASSAITLDRGGHAIGVQIIGWNMCTCVQELHY